MYHFISGYTAKVAGTEIGASRSPPPRFRPVSAGLFLVWHPSKYAELLADKIKKHAVRVWLVNTGWSGGAYGNRQSRIKLAQHPAPSSMPSMMRALASAKVKRDPVFGFDVVTECPGVPADILQPAAAWPG